MIPTVVTAPMIAYSITMQIPALIGIHKYFEPFTLATRTPDSRNPHESPLDYHFQKPKCHQWIQACNILQISLSETNIVRVSYPTEHIPQRQKLIEMS